MTNFIFVSICFILKSYVNLLEGYNAQGNFKIQYLKIIFTDLLFVYVSYGTCLKSRE